MQKEVKILSGQTLADIAIQETGWLEGIFDLAILNNISLTEDLAPGEIIEVDESFINESLHRLIIREGVTPATAFGYVLSENQEEPKTGGIGYMAVGIDFIIS